MKEGRGSDGTGRDEAAERDGAAGSGGSAVGIGGSVTGRRGRRGSD